MIRARSELELKIYRLRKWAVRFELVARQLAPRAAYARASDDLIILQHGWQETFKKLEARCDDAWQLWETAQACMNLANYLERRVK